MKTVVSHASVRFLCVVTALAFRSLIGSFRSRKRKRRRLPSCRLLDSFAKLCVPMCRLCGEATSRAFSRLKGRQDRQDAKTAVIDIIAKSDVGS